jgi:hypothetical protein
VSTGLPHRSVGRTRETLDSYLLEFQDQGEFFDLFGQKPPGILEVCMNECCDDCVRVRRLMQKLLAAIAAFTAVSISRLHVEISILLASSTYSRRNQF